MEDRTQDNQELGNTLLGKPSVLKDSICGVGGDGWVEGQERGGARRALGTVILSPAESPRGHTAMGLVCVLLGGLGNSEFGPPSPAAVFARKLGLGAGRRGYLEKFNYVTPSWQQEGRRTFN